MPALTYRFSFLSGGGRLSNPGPADVHGAYVDIFFALGWLFFALGRSLSASCTFETHVGRFFRADGRYGLDFGWSGQGFGAFTTTFVDDF